jgi:hypothetical protein
MSTIALSHWGLFEVRHGFGHAVGCNCMYCGAPRGERHWKAKITEADVRAIRASKGTTRDLAKQFGIAASTISNIRAGVRWKHV